MRKSFTEGADRQRVGEGQLVEVQIPLGLLASLQDVRQGFFSLCVSAGRQVLTAMMERDREALCGPKWIPNPQRRAHRAGTIRSEVTLGGRRIPIERLRARSIDGGELRLPSFGYAASRDPLDARTLEAIALGVSTRKYHRSLDPLPSEESERSVCRSSVSRRFVALSSQLLAKWMNRALDRLDVRVVIIDGIFLADHEGRCDDSALGRQCAMQQAYETPDVDLVSPTTPPPAPAMVQGVPYSGTAGAARTEATRNPNAGNRARNTGSRDDSKPRRSNGGEHGRGRPAFRGAA